MPRSKAVLTIFFGIIALGVLTATYFLSQRSQDIRNRAYDTSQFATLFEEHFDGDGGLDQTRLSFIGSSGASASRSSGFLEISVPAGQSGGILNSGSVSPRINSSPVYMPSDFEVTVTLYGLSTSNGWQALKLGTDMWIRRFYDATASASRIEVASRPNGAYSNPFQINGIADITDNPVTVRFIRQNGHIDALYQQAGGNFQLLGSITQSLGLNESLLASLVTTNTTATFDDLVIKIAPQVSTAPIPTLYPNPTPTPTPTPTLTSSTDNFYFDLRNLFFTIKESTTSAGTPTQELTGLIPNRQYYLDIQISVQNYQKTTNSNNTTPISVKLLSSDSNTRSTTFAYNLVSNHSGGAAIQIENFPFTPKSGANWLQFTLNDPPAVTETTLEDNLYTRAFSVSSTTNFDHNSDGAIDLLDYNLFLNALLNALR